MAAQKSKNNPTKSRSNSFDLRKKKSNGIKQDTQSYNEIKPEIRFKKAKKMSKSIKRIESKMSQIQIQMERIGNDLTTILDIIQNKKKN